MSVRCYHGDVLAKRQRFLVFGHVMNTNPARDGHARRFCPRPEPVHIKPHGDTKVICDSPSRKRAKAPAFVTGLMGATCQRCRKRFAKRAS